MKIIETQEVHKFKPVTVVFESQAEIDYIASLMAVSCQAVADVLKINIDTFKFYSHFATIASEPTEEAYTTIFTQIK